jgi:hypothetical protein
MAQFQNVYLFRNVADDEGYATLTPVSGTGASINGSSSPLTIPTSSWRQGDNGSVKATLAPGQYAVDVRSTKQDAQGGAGDVLYWSQERVVPPCQPSAGHICPLVAVAPTWTPFRPVPPAAFTPGPVPLDNGIVLTIGDPHEYLNGMSVTGSVAPFISNSLTVVPLRDVSQLLGATVQWVQKTREIIIGLNGHTVVMNVGSQSYTVDGDPHEAPLAPFIVPPGVTMVPLRVISEGLGQEVEWNGTTHQVFILSPASSTPQGGANTEQAGGAHIGV